MNKINKNVTLAPLEENDREQFITDNQEAFLYGATQEFGLRDNHFEEDGQIISRKTIERSIDQKGSETYRILLNGEEKVGGVVININKKTNKGELELLFVSPKSHSKGIGYSAWCLIEQMHPEIKIWETVTPYFEKRNIHFYVNRCGFHIVEFYNEFHPDPKENDEDEDEDKDSYNSDNDDNGGPDEMFRFVKIIKP